MNKWLLLIVIVLLLEVGIAAFVLSANAMPWESIWEQILAAFPFLSSKCGIESCHGLEITCGQNVPEACDAMYMAGDNCRMFVSCEKQDGKCQVVKSLRFEECKTCVQRCEAKFGSDPSAFFTCESACAQ